MKLDTYLHHLMQRFQYTLYQKDVGKVPQFIVDKSHFPVIMISQKLHQNIYIYVTSYSPERWDKLIENRT